MTTTDTVMDALEEREGGATAKVLSRATGLGDGTVRAALRSLERIGAVRRVKLPSVATRWEAIPFEERVVRLGGGRQS